MAGYKIISADSHVAEPPELYTEMVAEEFRHRTPRIEQRNGGTYRVVEGRKARRLDLAEARLTEEDREKEFRHEEWGGRNLERRVSEIERGRCQRRSHIPGLHAVDLSVPRTPTIRWPLPNPTTTG